MSKTDRLLKSVAARQRINGVLLWFARLVVTFGAIYATLLITSRLLSLLPLELDPLMSLAVPALALLAAIILYRGGGRESAARLVDRRMNTKDLFLTSSRLTSAPGEYKPLVTRAAEANAQRIKPDAVAPVSWRDPVTWATLTVLLLVVSTMYLPRLDPFGIHEEKVKLEERRKELAEQKKFNAERIKALQSEPLSDALSDQVEQALKELQQAFNDMRPEQMKPNMDRLNEHQRFIGDKWRKLGEQNLHRLDQSDSRQQFGQVNPMAHQWKKQLQNGDASGLRKQIDEARALARKLAQTTDSEQQRQLKEELQKKLRELADFAQNQAKTPGLEAALRKAMEQLQASGMQGLSSDALDALDSSLDLSALELEALAQSLRDMEALENALKLITLGKIANSAGKLGELGENPGSLAEYIELYEKICEECREGMCQGCNGSGKGKVGVCPFCKGTGKSGGGMGGPGRGRGNVAPEDDSVKSDFKTEKSKTSLQAGKMLLEIRQQELPEAGEAQVTYAENLEAIKQGVSESILAEQVPPGYHEGIKKYFDAIDAEDGK